MKANVVREWPALLPSDDDHPYRTGAWRPQRREWDAWDLTVLEGEIPRDLNGVYVRNTENPLVPAIGRYHPFDGDGMLHAITFEDGRASYRNRVVKTAGLDAELAAGAPLWAGILESPDKSVRDGWGARRKMKDASSTDVVVHRGVALSTFYQCGDVYQSDPRTLEQRGTQTWGGALPASWGVSAHPKLDEHTGELLIFNYGKDAPFMHYGVVSAAGVLDHYVPIALPGPRLPHDMAFTERFAILNDLPVFWDATLLEKNVHRARWHEGVPSRFAVVPRKGSDVRWFEAAPTYVLHWINAYEDGDAIVLDGYFQQKPMPEHHPGDDRWAVMHRSISIRDFQSRPHRWRFDLRTGETKEEKLDDEFTEFPMVHGRYAGRKHRYFVAMTNEPGWFLFNGIVRYDVVTGEKQRHQFPPGVFASESPIAPKTDGVDEADAYVVTFVTDVNADRSECQIFDLRDVGRGPIARVLLPERISSGTHATWVSLADLDTPPGPA